MYSYDSIQAGVKGVEPFSEVLETAILPMNYTPVPVGLKPDCDIIAQPGNNVNLLFSFSGIISGISPRQQFSYSGDSN